VETRVNFEAGNRLRAAANRIAEATLERDYARRPYLLDRYGEYGRNRYREDILYNVEALSASVDADDPGMFLRYVAWLKIVLVSRGVAADDIAESLSCMISALSDGEAGEHVAAVSNLQAAMQALASMPEAVDSFIDRSSKEHVVAKQCMDALLRLDSAAGREVLEDAIGAGMPLARIYTGILPPLMREIGRLWQMNKISVAHEHYCSAAVQSIVSGFYARLFGQTARSGRTMLVACVEGEQHELGARTLADVFELNGWSTSYVGANLPSRDLIALIKQAAQPPDMIALSATMPAHLGQLASTIDAIHDNSNVPIMVGGYLFDQCEKLAGQLGADGCANNAEPAVAIADALVARQA
jgi:MerR family transcriptional regulator, light-induced transcriptional regulator